MPSRQTRIEYLYYLCKALKGSRHFTEQKGNSSLDFYFQFHIHKLECQGASGVIVKYRHAIKSWAAMEKNVLLQWLHVLIRQCEGNVANPDIKMMDFVVIWT